MANKKIPMRQCIGCGEMKPKKEMIRVIKTAEDEIILDTTSPEKWQRCIHLRGKRMSLQKAIKCKVRNAHLKCRFQRCIRNADKGDGRI